jgi:hypothetical protein
MPQAIPWSDAWIFVAVALSGSPASLSALIHTADAINHAIPTAAEVNGALDRLQAWGLVRLGPEGVSVTEAGTVMFEGVQPGGRGMLALADLVHQALVREAPLTEVPAVSRIEDADISAVA